MEENWSGASTVPAKKKMELAWAHSWEVTTALWNKYYSGHHKAVEEVGGQTTLRAENWKKKFRQENGGGSTRQS